MPRNVHYVLSTHWDREWYQSFQDFRERLVRLLDRTIDAINDGTLRGPFTADGQAIVLEDYLEVRPSRTDDVRRLVREQKLVVGPWYVLPDEWLVSGESLIRNLRLGRQIARDFGGVPSDAGFVCDLFGHIGQMPQILAGFGIRAGLVWRGIEPRRSAHLKWIGVDGTSILCFRFGRTGYCDYSYDVRHSHEHAVTFDADRAKSDLDRYLEREAGRSSIPPVLLFDGGDHLEFDAHHYATLMRRADDADSLYAIRHSTLDAYLNEMLEHADAISDVFEGEMRESGRLPQYEDKQWLIPGVLSSRVWIKQANAACQTSLCCSAEPLATQAQARLGVAYPTEYLDLAWRWLLKNHPHDSICGCSIDAVHEDMRYRFAQSIQISEKQADIAARSIAASIDQVMAEDELRVTIFNPLPRELDEVVDLTLHIPVEWTTFNEFFGFEPKPGFHIIDATSGEELPYQRCAQDMDRLKMRVWDLKYPQPYRVNEVKIALRVRVPAGGYATLNVRPAESKKPYDEEPAAIDPTRWPDAPSLAVTERSMENEHLRVTIESNGTLTIFDKRTAESYSRLLTFEDGADIGDGWFHGQAANDEVFLSSSTTSQISLVTNGPMLCQFRIRTTLRVPGDFDFARMRRNEALVEMALDTTVGLRAGSDRVECECRVDNGARDHRLRVLFPSGVDSEDYLSDGAFDVVQRPVALPVGNHLSRELAVETRPQQTWTGIDDSKRGLSIVSTGLMEATVRDREDRPIALTLFRSTRRTVLTDGEPNGQLIGEMTFRFWIVPGTIDRTRLCERGTLLAAGTRAVQLRKVDVANHVPRASVPPSAAFIELDGDALLSSIRMIDGSTEVRLFNPHVEPRAVRLRVPGATVGHRVDFESNPLDAVACRDGVFEINIKPKEIITIRCDVNATGKPFNEVHG